MKKSITFGVSIVMLFILENCNSRTYDEISDQTPITSVVKYNEHVKPIIQNNCVICHSASGISSFAPFTTYTETKSSIDKILDRIQRPNGYPDKMPASGSISSSQIEIIKKWKTDGLLEN